MKYLLLLFVLLNIACAGEATSNTNPQSSTPVETEPILPSGQIKECGEYSYIYSNDGLLVIYGNRGIYEIREPVTNHDLRGTVCSFDYAGQYLYVHHENNTECTFKLY